uniref:Uncharacterized protein n=1 Tax=Sphaerodactylus townsendi TaxID=933632 RepID=A0ACB8ETT6_9SAUR
MSAPVQEGGGGGGSSSAGDAESLARRRLIGPAAGPAAGPGVRAAQRGLKVRNALTALAIGAVVVGIYGYTFYSVSQEHFLEQLELEAKAVRAQAAKTSAD